MDARWVVALAVVCVLAGAPAATAASRAVPALKHNGVTSMSSANPLSAAAVVGSGNGTGCSCLGNDCGCCAEVHIPEIHIDGDICANVTYLPKDVGFSITVSYNNLILINKTVSLEDPKFCFGIPYLKKLASICVDITDVQLSAKNVSGCVDIAFKLLDVTVEDLKLGCFHIPIPLLSAKLQAAHQQLLQQHQASQFARAHVQPKEQQRWQDDAPGQRRWGSKQNTLA
eukprot:m.264129 g.264129  ORF g.264129 m.264129 type:complete len:228 (+) comp19247_c6_seq9:4639-5322(+)